MFYNSTRSFGKLNKVIYPWMNRDKPYWVRQNVDPALEESLIPENKIFLEKERSKLLFNESPLAIDQLNQTPWIPGVTQRCGLIGIKLGTYPMWSKIGKLCNCTIIQVNYYYFVYLKYFL